MEESVTEIGVYVYIISALSTQNTTAAIICRGAQNDGGRMLIILYKYYWLNFKNDGFVLPS